MCRKLLIVFPPSLFMDTVGMRKLSATSCAQCQTIPFVTEVAKGIYTIIAPPNCPDKFLRQQTAVPTRNFTLPTTHRTTTRRWEGSVRTFQVSEKNSWFSYAAQRESEAEAGRGTGTTVHCETVDNNFTLNTTYRCSESTPQNNFTNVHAGIFAQIDG